MCVHVLVKSFGEDLLDLHLKARATRLALASQGLPILGWRLYWNHSRLRPENIRRSWQLVKHRQREHGQGILEEEALVQSMASIYEHLIHGSTHVLRRSWHHRREYVG